MGSHFFDQLTQKYPFITLCKSGTEEYVGVIQNRDDSVTTLYDYGALIDQQDKMDFLELASVWWWESNRSVPINIFLHSEWTRFRFTLRTFTNKELMILHGPVCSLSELTRRRSKRKSITLLRPLG